MNALRMLMALCAASSLYSQEVIATGLQSPVKIILTPGGNLLVAEAGRTANSGVISVVTRTGARRPLIEALPSGLDVTGSPLGPTGIALRGNTLYVLIGIGDVLRRGQPGQEVANPAGPSSGLLSSLWSIELSAPVDTTTGPFQVRLADTTLLLDGEETTMEDPVGNKAVVRLITDFRDYVPDRQTVLRGSDPYGLALDPDDPDLGYVADAGMNSLLAVRLSTGRVRTVLRVPPVAHTRRIGPPLADSVPTQVVFFGRQILVTRFSGFPFPNEHATVEVFDPATKSLTPFFTGLSTPIDVAHSSVNGRLRMLVLEFSADLLGDLPGRLRLYDSPQSAFLSESLITPTAMAFDAASGEIFITEYGPGRIVRVRAP
ncbi:MAG: ScyD/ScyE family protein [Bryobacteraceae bacterium]